MSIYIRPNNENPIFSLLLGVIALLIGFLLSRWFNR